MNISDRKVTWQGHEHQIPLQFLCLRVLDLHGSTHASPAAATKLSFSTKKWNFYFQQHFYLSQERSCRCREWESHTTTLGLEINIHSILLKTYITWIKITAGRSEKRTRSTCVCKFMYASQFSSTKKILFSFSWKQSSDIKMFTNPKNQVCIYIYRWLVRWKNKNPFIQAHIHTSVLWLQNKKSANFKNRQTTNLLQNPCYWTL